MPRYKKCPRCELNYILEEEDYCEVCKAELKGINTEIEDEEDILCPKCKQNYVEAGEKFCAACLQKMQDDWDEDVKPDVEEDEDLTSLSEMEEQEWADDEIDSFDDNDGFGNEADFIDIDEEFDGKDQDSDFDEEEEDFVEDELEKDFEEVEQFQDLDDIDFEDEEEFEEEDL